MDLRKGDRFRSCFEINCEDTEEIYCNISQKRRSTGIGNTNPTGISFEPTICNTVFINVSKKSLHKVHSKTTRFAHSFTNVELREI